MPTKLTDDDREAIKLNASGEYVYCGDYHSALEIARNACASDDWEEAECDEAAAIAMAAWQKSRGRDELTDEEREAIKLHASKEDVYCGNYDGALQVAADACASTEDWSKAAQDEAAAVAMKAWRETREE